MAGTGAPLERSTVVADAAWREVVRAVGTSARRTIALGRRRRLRWWRRATPPESVEGRRDVEFRVTRVDAEAYAGTLAPVLRALAAPGTVFVRVEPLPYGPAEPDTSDVREEQVPA